MNATFIQVILPLRLAWEPYYSIDTEVAVGDRVNVVFARRQYIGVVSAVGVTPEGNPGRIRPAAKAALPPVSPAEVSFWKAIGQYYLCTVGEVYKAAYPQGKIQSEEVAVRVQERLEKRLAALQEKEQKARKESTREKYRAAMARVQALLQGEEGALTLCTLSLTASQESFCREIAAAFGRGKTVLVEGNDPDICLEMARQTLSAGRNVLFLVPEIGLSSQLEERLADFYPGLLTYHSGRSIASRRAVADAVRTDPSYLVVGTRSALFLPHRNLGLIVVVDEHDSSYKQDSPAPRFHAREAAILLALQQRSSVLLTSSTPSLESLYNAENGRFIRVDLKQPFTTNVELVNLSAEWKKKGMNGSFSLKLLERMHAAFGRGEKVLLLCPSKSMLPDFKAESDAIFPGAAIDFATPASCKTLDAASYGLIGVLLADTLLSREDFRSDERALQLLRQMRGKTLLLQTREPGHPVFKALKEGQNGLVFLPERQAAAYPPCTRVVDVHLHDPSEKRLDCLGKLLAGNLRPCLGPYALPRSEQERVIRVAFPRDKSLQQRKQALFQAVSTFETEHKYTGHIFLDVDPV